VSEAGARERVVGTWSQGPQAGNACDLPPEPCPTARRLRFLVSTRVVNRSAFGLAYRSRHLSVSVRSSHLWLSDALVTDAGIEVGLP